MDLDHLIFECSEAKVLDESDEAEHVYQRAVHLLSLREHGVNELRSKLQRKFGCSLQLDEIIDRLISEGYLSDERFIEGFLRSRQNKGQGPIKIKHDLTAKGVDGGLLDDYLDFDDRIWVALASEQYRKKFGNHEVADYKEWTRRARFLTSRGFTQNQVRKALPDISS